MTPARRVVITGSGFVLPLGECRKTVAAALDLPHGPFVRAPFDSDVAACPIPDFTLKNVLGRCKDARYLSRGQQLCLAAAVHAVDDARLSSARLSDAGLFLGLGPDIEARPREDKALWLLHFLPNTATAILAKILGLHGENLTIMTACAASLQALGQAFHAIRDGRCEFALAGGGDSRLSAPGTAAYKQAGVLATGFARPEEACRPFDRDRSGFAIGEGGAVFALETLDHALDRKAPILAEIVAATSSLDGHSLTDPDPAGSAAGNALGRCLDACQTTSPCVVAHGTGTRANDAMEGQLLRTAVPQAALICAFKSRIGHLASACGAAELALALLCASNKRFPAIANLEHPCLDGLPLARTATSLHPDVLLLENFGFGGQNACLGVRPWR